MGRCPSQGSDSALLIKVMAGDEGVDSVRVPLEICLLTNADFHGDELWTLAPMSLAGEEELDVAWYRVCGTNSSKSVFGGVGACALEKEMPAGFDSAMLTTVTFEEMSEHMGEAMYNSMILKSESGIVNTIMSRHSLAGPYGFMRMGMMLDNVRDDALVINSPNVPALSILNVTEEAKMLACSSAMTKLTKIIYQTGIDTSKHSVVSSKIAAVSTLLTDTGKSYRITGTNNDMKVVLMPTSDAQMNSYVYTSMNSTLKARHQAASDHLCARVHLYVRRHQHYPPGDSCEGFPESTHFGRLQTSKRPGM
ncbi:hypothetical protein LTR74_018386 [Friedmanniomyces endolithicus]|nr:hypothetical protein LTR74_018386 [Friedmanniomyces endolithicus]